ncbi:hypothetical protein BN14_10268 [Rhizoctonia solani AG-1 IB]|uniref:Uncharacterized protein n=1 Tax=Thanatephorus cucumeris (strain AG1-IB / isolate 7/3/14) TaxID=1108050 RepID=M5C864_THACB|nr:hypothetical protein BN14_10268 [Rhizoctonia solani AG-1 IB]
MFPKRTIVGGYLDSSEDKNVPCKISAGRLGNNKTKSRAPTSEPGESSQKAELTASAELSTSIPSASLNRVHSLSSDSEDLDGAQPSKGADCLIRPQPVQKQIDRLKDTGRARLAVSSERQYNELKSLVDDARRVGEQQYHDVNQKMDLVLATLTRLESMRSSNHHPSNVPPDVTIQASAPLDDTRNYLANPPLTEELARTITRVVNDRKNRVGKKKGGAEENSLKQKEHTRDSWYGMIDIECSKDITVYFEHKNGEPDTLPVFFADRQTGYRRPRPHWKESLLKQMEWAPTFLKWFRATIPNNNSELSTLLRSLSDEQIIILLCDGPFKTAATVWRDRKYTDAQIKELRSIERRKHRALCKATVRRSYTTGLPSLRGPGWEYLTHPGYMSAEESDSEDEVTIKRPAYRATWVNNLFGAIEMAELKRGMPVPNSAVVIVPLSIPKLERKSGAGNETMRIPLCSLGKAWCKDNAQEVDKSSDLINSNITIKPSIDDFLSEHPVDVKLHRSAQSGGGNEAIANNTNATEGKGDDGDELPEFPIDPELLLDDTQWPVTGTERVDSKYLNTCLNL